MHYFFHSPFSPSTVAHGSGPTLLLQFIVRELTKGEVLKESLKQEGPFGWTCQQGTKNKVAEHAHLLPYAFPHLAARGKQFLSQLDLPCHQLIALLEPFNEYLNSSSH